MSSVSTLSESALIERLRRRAGRPPAWVPLGIGDDAAAIEPARNALDVVTTDASSKTCTSGARGPRARDRPQGCRVNLSDLAAMGATPRALLLSLALPGDFPLDDFDELIDGVVGTAGAAGAPLVGGNLARSPGRSSST